MALKWRLCLLLFLATTLNYLDRQTMSILAPILQKEMGLDNEALGWLFAVFYYAYTFSQFAVGPLLDRLNLRWRSARPCCYGRRFLPRPGCVGSSASSCSACYLESRKRPTGPPRSASWPAPWNRASGLSETESLRAAPASAR